MDLQKLRKIRKMALIAIFADDYLLEKFVLKGGSAIDLAYKIDGRASIDIDVSMENDFNNDEFEEVKTKLEMSLNNIFQEEGFFVFDYKFDRSPLKKASNQPFFWGGYSVEFKFISADKKDIIIENLDKARQLAEVVNQGNGKKFTIDISKFEYCKEKMEVEIDGYTVYVYTPKMLVIEKLRAICQGMKEYKLNHCLKPARTRDFYDIYLLVQSFEIQFSSQDKELIEAVFKIKEVEIDLLGNIEKYRKHYYQGIGSLYDTIPTDRVLNFDVYFEFVLNIVKELLPEMGQKIG